MHGTITSVTSYELVVVNNIVHTNTIITIIVAIIVIIIIIVFILINIGIAIIILIISSLLCQSHQSWQDGCQCGSCFAVGLIALCQGAVKSRPCKLIAGC